MPLLPDEKGQSKKITVQNWQPIDFGSEETEPNVRVERELYQTTADLNTRFTDLIELIKEKKPLNISATTKDEVNRSNKDGYQTWQPAELEIFQGMVGNESEQVHTRYAQNQAQEILRKAKADSAEILRQAELEAKQILEDAHLKADQIHQQAYRDGLAAANSETQSMLMTAKSILEEVQVWKEAMFEQGEMMMLRLVIEIAQTMFGDGLPLDPDTLGQAFSRALNQAKTLGNLRIFVHPEDAAILTAHWNKLQGAIGGQQVELIPSEIIKRGGCYIDGQFGSVDARVETQFQTIKDSLLTSLEKTKQGAMV